MAILSEDIIEYITLFLPASASRLLSKRYYYASNSNYLASYVRKIRCWLRDHLRNCEDCGRIQSRRNLRLVPSTAEMAMTDWGYTNPQRVVPNQKRVCKSTCFYSCPACFRIIPDSCQGQGWRGYDLTCSQCQAQYSLQPGRDFTWWGMDLPEYRLYYNLP